MPAFNFRHVKDLYSIFWSKSQELTDKISETIKSSPDGSSVVEIGHWASRATLDIIGVAGMGKDFDAISNPNNELNETYLRWRSWRPAHPSLTQSTSSLARR